MSLQTWYSQIKFYNLIQKKRLSHRDKSQNLQKSFGGSDCVRQEVSICVSVCTCVFLFVSVSGIGQHCRCKDLLQYLGDLLGVHGNEGSPSWQGLLESFSLIPKGSNEDSKGIDLRV